MAGVSYLAGLEIRAVHRSQQIGVDARTGNGWPPGCESGPVGALIGLWTGASIWTSLQRRDGLSRSVATSDVWPSRAVGERRWVDGRRIQ